MTILNLFIPRAALGGLSIPELAVTDGSGQPEWVDFPCLTAWAYSRPTILRLPLDGDTAAIARRWIRFHRMERAVLRPAFLALGATSLALVYFGDIADLKVHGIQLALLVAAFGLLRWAQKIDTNLTVRVHPEVFARSGVHIPGVSPLTSSRRWELRESYSPRSASGLLPEDSLLR